MTDRVDTWLAAGWQRAGVTPAPPADDAEFLRRAALDLVGRIPSVQEVREYLASTDLDKRQRLLDELLRRPAHAAHLADLWGRMLLPPRGDQMRQVSDAGFRNWLRTRFAENVPYDRVVAELLLASGSPDEDGPALYYTALELKPEELAANSAKVLLGVQIQCAQCHDHPFDAWSQEQFWQFAAYFAQVRAVDGNNGAMRGVMDGSSGEVLFPTTQQPAAPAVLQGEMPAHANGSRRRQLAVWLTSPENPYFARATVNRVWAQLFGRGLVEPADDFSPRNPPSHPELLDELSAYFVASDYDLNGLVRVLAGTRAYALASTVTSPGDYPPKLFAAMSIKPLTAEQLYDCLQEAMRAPQAAPVAADPLGSTERDLFVARFAAPAQHATEYQSGIPQALTLMNGRLTSTATGVQESPLLGALAAPFLNDAQRIEVLFVSTLSRPPTDEERTIFAAYVEQAEQPNAGLGDVLWALLNSAEFAMNH